MLKIRTRREICGHLIKYPSRLSGRMFGMKGPFANMAASKNRVCEFQDLYRLKFGESISLLEAEQKLNNLLTLIRALMREKGI